MLHILVSLPRQYAYKAFTKEMNIGVGLQKKPPDLIAASNSCTITPERCPLSAPSPLTRH